jgi:hypothetical protein
MKATTITLSALLLSSVGLTTACNEGATEADQHVEGDECPKLDSYIITDDSEGAEQLGISYYIASSSDPLHLALEVIGTDGEHLGSIETFSDGLRGARTTVRLPNEPGMYELIMTDTEVVAMQDGRRVGSWHATPDEGLVQDGDLDPGAAYAIALATTGLSSSLDHYGLFGLEFSSWKCIKLKAKALAYAALCVTGAVAAGFVCTTVVGCIAAGAGAVVACINYTETYELACDCDCWPWKC